MNSINKDLPNIHIMGVSHPTARYLFNFINNQKNNLFLYSSKEDFYFKNKKIYKHNFISNNCLSNDVIVSISPIHIILQHIRSLFEKKIYPSRIICISSSSIYSKVNSNSLDKELFCHFQESEDSLKYLYKESQSQTNFIILRPTMLWGDGYDKNIEFIHKFMNKFNFFPVSSNSSGLRSPIHYEDLAFLLSKLLFIEISGFRIFDVTGEDDLPFIELVKLIKRNSISSKFLLILKIPASLINLLISLFNFFPRNKLFSKIYYVLGFLSRQSDNLIFRFNDIKSIVPFYTKCSLKKRIFSKYNNSK